MAKKPIAIPSVEDESNYIVFTLPDKTELRVIRMDFLDEDEADELSASVEALNHEFEFGSVAADIAAMAPDQELVWVPLSDSTKSRLLEMGVRIERILYENRRADKITIPDEDEDVLAGFEEFRDFKPTPTRRRGKDVALVMFKHVVSEEEYAKLEKLRVGQLEYMLAEWRKHSKVSLGE